MLRAASSVSAKWGSFFLFAPYHFSAAASAHLLRRSSSPLTAAFRSAASRSQSAYSGGRLGDGDLGFWLSGILLSAMWQATQPFGVPSLMLRSGRGIRRLWSRR